MRFVLVLVVGLSARAALADDGVALVNAAMQERCAPGLKAAFADKPALVTGDFNADGKPDWAAVVDAPAAVKATVPNTFGYGLEESDDAPASRHLLLVLWGGAKDCVLLGGRSNAVYGGTGQTSGEGLLSVAHAKKKKRPDALLVGIQPGADARLAWNGKNWKWIEPEGGD